MTPHSVSDPLVNARPPRFDRAHLYGVLDGYLAALKRRDPNAVTWSPQVRNTENNVALMVGDGLWGTASALDDYDLRFADPITGQVGFFGVVQETVEASAFSLRLGLDSAGAVAEAETLVARQSDSGLKFENPRFDSKPILNEIVALERRLPRARMQSLADGYFDTLQLNDGALFTRFHPDCNRVENGVQTTNNPNDRVFAQWRFGCEAQFRAGAYRFDDRLRGRRFPLVDEERGLVLAYAFIDHSGRLGDYQLTDGGLATSPVRRPHSFYMAELFKIADGMIEQIEANFITVPYHMPSPWNGWSG